MVPERSGKGLGLMVISYVPVLSLGLRDLVYPK